MFFFTEIINFQTIIQIILNTMNYQFGPTDARCDLLLTEVNTLYVTISSIKLNLNLTYKGGFGIRTCYDSLPYKQRPL